ncbi:hypothetical protein EYZ11_012144 [Aspergillus tanneri]|nr:hypothetical protein EYZ11_012144 [Aspergillus tanneri]
MSNSHVSRLRVSDEFGTVVQADQTSINPLSSTPERHLPASALMTSSTPLNISPNTEADAVFTDANATVQLFIVDVGAAPLHNNYDKNRLLFQPQALQVLEGDTVLFRLHGPYILYQSDHEDPCHLPRLSLNSVPNNDTITSYRFTVQSSESIWFSASPVDRPFACNNETTFAINPGPM